MIRWLMNQWYKRCRNLDLEFLWPIVREKSDGNLVVARAAFAYHAFHDTAWLVLGEDEIKHSIDRLC